MKLQARLPARDSNGLHKRNSLPFAHIIKILKPLLLLLKLFIVSYLCTDHFLALSADPLRLATLDK